MKAALLILAATLGVSPTVSAQSSTAVKTTPPAQQAAPDPFAGAPPAKPADVDSLDHLLAALYDVISGPAGPRDWNRFRSLFLPAGRLTATGKNPDASIRVRAFSVEDYINLAGAGFLKNGFFERSLVNHVDTYGQVSQVFSSYESRHNANDEAPFARGINSIQILNDGHRFWIVSILWDSERPDNPLPKDFTKAPNR